MHPGRSAHRGAFLAVPLAGLLALTACTSPTEATEADPASAETENAWQAQLLDAPHKPEDLIELASGTVFVSGMSADPGSADGGSGSLYTMDPVTGELAIAWPAPEVEETQNMERFGECPGPPDTSIASPHGLGAETAEDGTEHLYVVNHGGRESVEVFEVTAAGDVPDLTWVGCSVLPEESFGNGVAADPRSDGFYVTDFLNPADMEGEFERAFADEPTGAVLHWTPEGGWNQVPDSQMSTPNGIAVSEDGASLYVASWGGREIVELDAVTGERLSAAPIDLMPDNLRYTDDGRILVTGQVIDDFDTFLGYEFGDLEPEERYDVYALSPDTFTLEPIAQGNVPGFGNPTTALDVDGRIFVGSVAGDKILQLDPSEQS